MLNLFSRNNRYEKYIIVSAARSGSTMLSNMLRNHPHVNAQREYFDRIRGRSPEELWRELFRPQKRSVRAVGFNIHYNQPVDEKRDEVWGLIENEEKVRMIHLVRDNLLRTYVSAKIANKVKLFRLFDEAGRPDLERRRIVITPREFQENIDAMLAYYRFYETIAASKPSIRVVYEELAASPEPEFARITDFLGLPRRRPVIVTKVMNPEPLEMLVSNYAELKEAFASTQWARFFE